MRGNSALSAVRTLRVDAEASGRRLDNLLLGELKGVPRSRIYRLIRTGQVRVNGRRARPETRVALGDEVRLPPVRTPEQAREHAPPADRVAWLAQRILYEDRDLLALDKPAGLAVHGGSGVSFGAIELLRAARPDEPGLELVHRLDRDTSGCLLVARRRPALRRLHALLREGAVAKRYTALVVGRLAGGERRVDAPLLTTERRGGERHVRVDAGGKPAVSRFVPVRRFAQATLVDVWIETGRTHQIRVHAAHLGHPVAGDERYGAADDPVVAGAGLGRLFLHAASIAFDAPGDGRVLRVEAPLPAELAAVLARLASA